jgi:glycosyltransferase involved in cell wall biosynthesis
MKIAVWYNLHFGGAKRALYYHLKSLKEAGFDIEIWSLTERDDIINFKELGKIHTLNVGEKEIGSMQGSFGNPRSIIKTLNLIGKLKKYQKKCADEINEGNFDLALINSCSVSYMPYIGEFLNIPSVLYLGEPYRWLYEASPENPWKIRRIENMSSIVRRLIDFLRIHSKRIQVTQEIESAKKYTKILVNSRYSRESVLRSYGIECEVCNLGVDTNLFRNIDKKKGDYIVGLGLLYPPKGADRAIRLVSKIDRKIRPSLEWISNGRNDTYLKYLLELSKSLEVNFVAHINLPDEEMVKKLSGALFMLYTSRLEPLGLAPLEANACGTFVVGIAEGGVRETVSHNINGYLIENEDDDKFKDYAEELITDREKAIRLGLNARKYVNENWSLDNLKQNILAAINRVINQTSR